MNDDKCSIIRCPICKSTKPRCECADLKIWNDAYDEDIPTCYGCEQPVKIHWSKSYNGWRGYCDQCETNWAES